MSNNSKDERIPEEVTIISRMRISALWAVLMLGYIYEDFVSLFRGNHKNLEK